MSSGNAPKQRLQMKIRVLQALESLLETKDYNDIEINDICNQAHISKPTFYRYFKNKDNIFRWMTKVGFRCGIIEIGRRYTWYEGYLVSLMVAYRHRIFYSDKLNPEVVASLIKLGWNYQFEALRDTYALITGEEPDDRTLFLLEATARTQCEMTRRWAVEGMHVSPEIMADYLAGATPREIFEVFNNPLVRRDVQAEEVNMPGAHEDPVRR